MERMSANGLFFHRNCFKCSHCNCKLKMGNYSLSKGEGGEKGKFFCSVHYRQLFMSNPEAINYSRADAPKREQSKTDLQAEKEKSTQQMNGKPEQDTTKSKSVEDSTRMSEQVHISVEEVAENEAEVLSGDEHRELNGDLPADKDLQSEDLVSNSAHLEEMVIASEEEMVEDLQASEETGHGDLLEDEVGIANGDGLEKVNNTVNVKLEQTPQQVASEQLARKSDISIGNSSLDHQFSEDESEIEPSILALDNQVASPSHEPENPTRKDGITGECSSTCHRNEHESDKATLTALEQEIKPEIEDELTSKTDVTTKNRETNCAPCHQSDDKSYSEMTKSLAVVQEVAPEEGEQTSKRDTATEKHHNVISFLPHRRESERATNPVTLDYETVRQNGEPKRSTCAIQTPAQQKRVMFV